MPGLFGDERDITIQKFNQLEAYCGTGKGLTSYGGQAQLVPFTPQNPFARFKVKDYNMRVQVHVHVHVCVYMYMYTVALQCTCTCT